jgi:dipeptidyl aminopeptidase/acylaminoacyl peptidase
MWWNFGELARSEPGISPFWMNLLLVILAFALSAVAAARANESAESEEAEVEFPNGSIHLSGTLTLPPGGGPHPCVVLLTGHGMETRDAEALGFKFLESMAQQLAQRGLAVLRCDKRGTGKSTGKFREATLEDFADDALAAVRCLKSQKKIDGKRVGLCGHSEGGWTAALAASRSEDLDFLILLATFGIPVLKVQIGFS